MGQYKATTGGKFSTTGSKKSVGTMKNVSNLEGHFGKKSPHFDMYPTKGTEIGMVAEKSKKVLDQT